MIRPRTVNPQPIIRRGTKDPHAKIHFESVCQTPEKRVSEQHIDLPFRTFSDPTNNSFIKILAVYHLHEIIQTASATDAPVVSDDLNLQCLLHHSVPRGSCESLYRNREKVKSLIQNAVLARTASVTAHQQNSYDHNRTYSCNTSSTQESPDSNHSINQGDSMHENNNTSAVMNNNKDSLAIFQQASKQLQFALQLIVRAHMSDTVKKMNANPELSIDLLGNQLELIRDFEAPIEYKCLMVASKALKVDITVTYNFGEDKPINTCKTLKSHKSSENSNKVFVEHYGDPNATGKLNIVVKRDNRMEFKYQLKPVSSQKKFTGSTECSLKEVLISPKQKSPNEVYYTSTRPPIQRTHQREVKSAVCQNPNQVTDPQIVSPAPTPKAQVREKSTGKNCFRCGAPRKLDERFCACRKNSNFNTKIPSTPGRLFG